jgi:hypothetical protein
LKRQLVGLAMVLIAAVALADQTAQTTPQTFVSNFGRYRLTVFPLEDPQAFGTHLEWMVKPPPSDQRGVQGACEATLERWVGNRYEVVWRKPLVNKISPVSALVSAADGSFATFNDWDQPGYGENAVVIYSRTGDLVKKFALRDFMTAEQVEKLPHTIGSIQWGGYHIVDPGTEKTLILRVGIDGEWDAEKRAYRDVHIRMSDGRIVDQPP